HGALQHVDQHHPRVPADLQEPPDPPAILPAEVRLGDPAHQADEQGERLRGEERLGLDPLPGMTPPIPRPPLPHHDPLLEVELLASSLSKPMIIPHQTSRPAFWIRWTFSSRVPPARTFWNFLVSRSDSSLGLSMPMKTLTKLASTKSSISSASSARSIDASVKK